MVNNKFSLRDRLRSFGYAFNGLKILLFGEHNSWIHLTASVIAVAAGVFFHISPIEWAVIVLAIGFVFAAEILNTSIERLCDHISPAYHDMIKKVKDLSAAAVLIAAITALVVGLLIFLPKI